MKVTTRRFVTIEIGSIAGLIVAFWTASAFSITNEPNWLSLIIFIALGVAFGNIINYFRSGHGE